jgi:hypothetical protein
LSTWGARHGRPGYDAFRTGLTFAAVKRMLWVHNPDPSTWRYRRRGTVLGFWHSLKLQLWEQAQDDRREIPLRRRRAA